MNASPTDRTPGAVRHAYLSAGNASASARKRLWSVSRSVMNCLRISTADSRFGTAASCAAAAPANAARETASIAARTARERRVSTAGCIIVNLSGVGTAWRASRPRGYRYIPRTRPALPLGPAASRWDEPAAPRSERSGHEVGTSWRIHHGGTENTEERHTGDCPPAGTRCCLGIEGLSPVCTSSVPSVPLWLNCALRPGRENQGSVADQAALRCTHGSNANVAHSARRTGRDAADPRARRAARGGRGRHPGRVGGREVARAGGARPLPVRRLPPAAARAGDASHRLLHRELADGVLRPARPGRGPGARAPRLHLRAALHEQALRPRGDRGARALPRPAARPHGRGRDPEPPVGARARHHRRGPRAGGERAAAAARDLARRRGDGEPDDAPRALAPDAPRHLPLGGRRHAVRPPGGSPDRAPAAHAREPAPGAARVRLDPAAARRGEGPRRRARRRALGWRGARLPPRPGLRRRRRAGALPALLRPRGAGVVRQVAPLAPRAWGELPARAADRAVGRLRRLAPRRQDPGPERLLRNARSRAHAPLAGGRRRERAAGRRAARAGGDGAGGGRGAAVVGASRLASSRATRRAGRPTARRARRGAPEHSPR